MLVLNCKLSLVVFFLYFLEFSSAIINGTIAVDEIDVNGKKVRPSYSDKYPFVVEILKRELHYCGGALIRQNAVITAARCISLDRTLPGISEFALLAGNQIIKEDHTIFEQRRSVAKIVFAHDWSKNNPEADYALLKPSSDFELTRWVNVISMDYEWTDPYTYGKHFGWGYTENKRYSSLLRYANTYVQEGHVCFENEFVPGQVCLNEAYGYPCYGDFGGPVIAESGNAPNEYSLVALVSYNPGADTPGYVDKITCEDEMYTKGVNITYFRSDIDRIADNEF